ncbi:hypothetical protein IQ244_20255 [Nostoc sp. LEGE 06077]|uniref:hypothetical protein n=1 Tax=Nostoc sp. LEGE 06077 TaxID=915325 RepID=UPI001882BE01|nr:hypothetical protein [Nostoc sp. LEGE 06077]MBE9208832.1 hypothetical protein [Nostoc sp. LEGE 06077]
MPLTNPSSNVTVTDQLASTSTRITGATSTTAAQIIPSNTSRLGLTIYNPTSITVYIDTVASPTASQHQFPLSAKGFYEMPDNKIYTGAFYAIAASGTPTLEIREFT